MDKRTEGDVTKAGRMKRTKDVGVGIRVVGRDADHRLDRSADSM
jgi:hypothetical protein